MLSGVPRDPPVHCWRWIAEADLDLTAPCGPHGIDGAAWAEARAHGAIWVDGRPAGDVAPAGGRVAVYTFERPPPPLALPPDAVLLDTDGVVAVNKPAGLSTQRTRASAHRCLEALLRVALADPGLRAVHRLDRDTSGVVLFARDGASAAALHAQFRARQPAKRYLAVVSPPPADAAFTVRGRIHRLAASSPEPAPLRFALGDHPDGRDSETRFVRHTVRNGYALIEAHPLTGRTHQIRVHLAHRGHPIAGDVLYGGVDTPRLMLHAAALGIEIGGRRVDLECPPPAGFWPMESDLSPSSARPCPTSRTA